MPKTRNATPIGPQRQVGPASAGGRLARSAAPAPASVRATIRLAAIWLVNVIEEIGKRADRGRRGRQHLGRVDQQDGGGVVDRPRVSGTGSTRLRHRHRAGTLALTRLRGPLGFGAVDNARLFNLHVRATLRLCTRMDRSLCRRSASPRTAGPAAAKSYWPADLRSSPIARCRAPGTAQLLIDQRIVDPLDGLARRGVAHLAGAPRPKGEVNKPRASAGEETRGASHAGRGRCTFVRPVQQQMPDAWSELPGVAEIGGRPRATIVSP
jgi:hypothetical protein